MTSTMTGSAGVRALWRYPVKSMQGEAVTQAAVTARGLTGDRVYALLEQATGKVVSAKQPRKWAGLLACQAAYQADASVQITLPDGAIVHSAQPDCDARLSATFHAGVTLTAVRPATPSVENFDPFAESVADIGAFMLRDGFADYAPIHLLTTATLARLQELYPQSRFDRRRFRPNIVVRADEAFSENAWVGRTLLLGGEVRLRISDPAPRCVMTTSRSGAAPTATGRSCVAATE